MITCRIWTEQDREKEAACTRWAAREKVRATEGAAVKRIKEAVNMPGFDGTGPYGTGPLGRGMGPCGRGARGAAGFDAGRGIRRGRFAYAAGRPKEERIRVLRAEKEAIEREIQELEKE